MPDKKTNAYFTARQGFFRPHHSIRVLVARQANFDFFAKKGIRMTNTNKTNLLSKQSNKATPRFKPEGADHILTVDELCFQIGITRSTYNRLRKNGGSLPRSYAIGGKRFYPAAEVDTWLKAQLA